MRINPIRLLPAVWAIAMLLVISLAPIALAQQAKKTAAPPGVPFLLLPGSPLDVFLSAPGIQPPLIYKTSTAHTRPEKANPNRPVGPQYLQEGQALGNEGVVDAGRFPLPFGTKGEKVALAFLSGEYVPPQGEKLQPALAQLAQQRAAQLSTQGSDARPAVYALILLNGRLDEGLQAWLAERGVELFGFYPYTAYQARIPVDALNEVASHPQVRWVGQPNPLQKLDPELLYFMGDRTGERIWLYVNLFAADESAKEAIASMAAETGVYDPSLGVFAIVADAGTVNRLLDMDAVLFVEPIRPSHTMHTQSQASINADLLWYYGHDGRPEGGRSIKAGVMDTGLNIYHWDFTNIIGGTAGYNRTTETNVFDDVHGHGTHVTGTFIGEGVAQFRYRGVAQGLRNTGVDGFDLLVSKVFRQDGWSQGGSIYQGLLDMQGREARYTRQVFNLSGGFDGTNLPGTDAHSRKVDEMFQQGIVPVISAGNEGPGGSTIGSPAVAKGAFTVGSIYDDGETTVDQMRSTSSRGPTGDSRVKPDVVAPGIWIDSCSNSSNNGYAYDWSGTSMAAPHVAGLVAGMIGHFNMPAWATKSTIIANAINLGHASTAQGRGKVDAFLSHYAVDGGWNTHWDSNGGTGSLKTIDFSLSSNVALLRIVLVYPDAPAPAGGSVALKNDLDLYLDRAPFSGGASGEWYSISKRDNVEVINVLNATAGNYRIKVHTYAQNEGSWQAWAVTHKVVVGDTTPNVTISLSAPVAVKPNVNFDVTGSARADSYVASGVYGDLDLLSDGITLNGMTYVRWAPDGREESVYFDGTDGMNQGNIPAGYTRRLIWSLKGTTEGSKSIRYDITSINGGTASVTRTVIVDGTEPGGWRNFAVTGVGSTGLTPTCTVQVRDVLSGLATSWLARYRYSTNGGSTWSGWYSAAITGSDGTTNFQTITASDVPFNQQSATQNKIQFAVRDMAGNWGYSPQYTVATKYTTVLDLDNASGTIGQPATLTATLRRVADNAPLSGKSISFVVDGDSAGSASTNASGVATRSWVVTVGVLGNRTMSASFAGDSAYHDTSDTATFRRYANTAVTVSNVSGVRGETVALKAKIIRTHDGAAIAGRTLSFKVDGNPVGSAVTNTSGVATTSYAIPADAALGEHLIKVVFAGDDPLNPSSGTGTLTVSASTRRVAGTVDLQDFSGDPSTQSVTIEIRNPGSTSPLETHVVSLDSSSQYSFDTALNGTFDVAAKASHWLRQVRGSISITSNVTVNFSLVNGDIDDDNEVTLFDFGALVAAFGSLPGDGNWNPNADLDGDEEVTLFDFGILVRNFGAIGDE